MYVQPSSLAVYEAEVHFYVLMCYGLVISDFAVNVDFIVMWNGNIMHMYNLFVSCPNMPNYGFLHITDGSFMEPSVITYHRRFYYRTVCDMPLLGGKR